MDAVEQTFDQRPSHEAQAEGAVRRSRPKEAQGSDLRPIGPKRLRELREAIRNGTYPSDEYVEKGLLRMFGRPRRRSDGE